MMKPGDVKVFVRMYRASAKAIGKKDSDYVGMLGDCFLIRIIDSISKNNVHILIDCGMLMGSDDASQRAALIAQDIEATTGGVLDLLVITHEHWDHISGFSQARDILLNPERLKIATLWMAWTEKDGDPQVARLRARFDGSGAALAALSDAIAKSSSAGARGLRSLQALQGFQGQLSADGKGGKALLGREIMQALKQVSGKVDFLEPGTVLHTPEIVRGSPQLKTFVLGPPRDEKWLFKDKPSSGARQETYFETVAFSNLAVSALAGSAAADAEIPFSRGYGKISSMALEEKRESGASLTADENWLLEQYYGETKASQGEAELLGRRQIDDDWIAAAGPLALKLDSDTNNTSLVLAFELPDGTIMLFPGDAQVGNWESWHSRTYRDDNGAEYTAEQILSRVKFYKVGHHGSHNATMRQHGLDMMTRADLVAAIPTDEALGKKQGGGWQMPNPRVNQALKDRTSGRIIRNDFRYTSDDVLDPFGKVDGDHRLKDTDLYLEYQIL